MSHLPWCFFYEKPSLLCLLERKHIEMSFFLSELFINLLFLYKFDQSLKDMELQGKEGTRKPYKKHITDSHWRKLLKSKDNDVILMFSLLTLNRFQTMFWCFHCWLEQVNRGWEVTSLQVGVSINESTTRFWIY